MVTIQINDKIEELFTDFIFMTAKFRTDFDSATVASPDFLDLRNSTSNQIFQDISSTEHYGFFIFSYFDDLCQEINKILERYNGGGHKFAAGARIKTFDEIEHIIKDFDEACKEYKKENKLK